MELKEYRFDEITVNFDKKRVPLSGAQREKRQGKYRYYGAQGVIDHIDEFIFDGTYLLIAEDGENLKSKKQNIAQVVDGQFWVNNHAHIVQGNALCDTRYLCYLLNSIDLSGYVTGSAQPKLSQANLNAVTLSLPSIDMQKKIVECLYMFDQKIAVNQKINDNLNTLIL
ncbi:MAG: restriction endonuclease subunit S [Flavonifractor plautii]